MHLASLFGGTLISCGWSFAAPRAGALSVFWTAAIPRLSAFQRALSIFARCYSCTSRTPFSRRIHRAVVCVFLAVTMHLYPRAALKFCMTHISREKNNLMFGCVCRNGQARSRSINYFHAYRIQIVQSNFIYRYRASLIDSYHLYASHSSRVRIIWNSC